MQDWVQTLVVLVHSEHEAVAEAAAVRHRRQRGGDSEGDGKAILQPPAIRMLDIARGNVP